MRKRAVLAFVVSSVIGLTAQASVHVGVAIGQQSYESSSDNPRILTGGDVLFQRGRGGVHVAAEYADLSEEGALIVIHPDVVYRRVGKQISFLAGAGPTIVNTGSSDITWNAELEIGHSFGNIELFGRVRQYDFGLARFREGEAGPSGPAVYAGVRFAVTH